MGIPNDAVLLLSVGELNENKNHQAIIKAVSYLNNMNIHYIIAGCGEKLASLKNLAMAFGIAENIHLIGYRTDINELCMISDIFCFPSYREGLGLAALEAMASGLPIVTSNVHGINDYSENGVTGYKCGPDDIHGFAEAIRLLAVDLIQRNRMGRYNQKLVSRYDIKNMNEIMQRIYTEMK